MGSGKGERLLSDDLVVSLRYADGSLATITYATGGHAQTEKESIEILGRGRAARISNFETVTFDGRTLVSGHMDKGHVQLCEEFWRAVTGPEEPRPADAFASTKATLLAASLVLGQHDARTTGAPSDPR